MGKCMKIIKKRIHLDIFLYINSIQFFVAFEFLYKKKMLFVVNSETKIIWYIFNNTIRKTEKSEG